MIDKQKQGKRNRAAGARWELKVRGCLKKEGWNVSKFQSNVELPTEKKELYGITEKQHTDSLEKVLGKLIPAKPSNMFRRGTLGFPDFICWKVKRQLCRVKQDVTRVQFDKIRQQLEEHKNDLILLTSHQIEIIPDYEIIGVECKVNGYLDKIEKAKCKWLLENKIFQKILIAKKMKEGRKLIPEYINFAEKYL